MARDLDFSSKPFYFYNLFSLLLPSEKYNGSRYSKRMWTKICLLTQNDLWAVKFEWLTNWNQNVNILVVHVSHCLFPFWFLFTRRSCKVHERVHVIKASSMTIKYKIGENLFFVECFFFLLFFLFIYFFWWFSFCKYTLSCMSFQIHDILNLYRRQISSVYRTACLATVVVAVKVAFIYCASYSSLLYISSHAHCIYT